MTDKNQTPLTEETSAMTEELCPCGSGKNYGECCEPFHNDEVWAPTAEALLRARYSAFITQNVDFVFRSTFPDNQKTFDHQGMKKWMESTEWLNLEIIDITEGGREDHEGTIEFKAEFTENKKTSTHHEISVFKKKFGKWYFFDGEPAKPEQYIRETPKIGRNEPCICGSGKKYKKCCGKI